MGLLATYQALNAKQRRLAQAIFLAAALVGGAQAGAVTPHFALGVLACMYIGLRFSGVL